jgi:Zn-dependent M28 family amino/carboxypeptidase
MSSDLRSVISALSFGVVLSCASGPQAATTRDLPQTPMQVDLTYLASPALAGRLTGTPGNDSAASYIAHRYASLGLLGAFDINSCGRPAPCEETYYQVFRYLSAYPSTFELTSQNVAGIVPGTDSTLMAEYVVVGAHYDHLGRSNDHALDPWQFPLLHLGADDNGSGTVGVLELARRLAAHPARRSIIFANFSAEELGLIGSTAFVKNSPVPRDSIIAMLNLDMIGRLRGKHVILYRGGDNERFDRLVDSVERLPPALDFDLEREPTSRAPSDEISFERAGIPVLGFFSDYHADYHRAGDVVARINFAGLETIVDLSERVVRAIADGSERPHHGR